MGFAIAPPPPRNDFLPPPDMAEVMNGTPMHDLAMQSVAQEYSTRFQSRMANSAPPRPNQPPQAAPTSDGGPPASGMAPGPSSAPPLDAGPRLLSPTEWATRFMPNLANQPYVSNRQLKLLHEGYKAYVGQTGNEQQRAQFLTRQQQAERELQRRETRDDVRDKENTRRFDLTDKRLTESERRAEAREAAAQKRFEETQVALDRRNREDNASREKIAAGREQKEEDPEKALTREAINAMKGQNLSPEDILKRIAADKRAPSSSDASLLDRGDVNDGLFGVPLVPGQPPQGGLLNEEPGMESFQKLQNFVKQRLVVANESERAKLKALLKDRAPYKTIDEAEAAYAAGAFDPPAEETSWLTPSKWGEAKSPEKKQARNKQAQQAVNEYIGSVFSPEEIEAARKRGRR